MEQRQKTVKAYKFVTDHLKSKNGNTQWIIGEWQKHNGDLSLCNGGFHACLDPLDSLEYTYGDKWFIVAAKGELVKGDDKFCCSEMKLVKEIPVSSVLVPFAIACARRCYKNWKDEKDGRVLAAIEAAERCFKEPTQQNIDAAKSAARSAEWSAARSAERDWQRKTLKQLISKALKQTKTTTTNSTNITITSKLERE
jgi:hypothetical protein